MFQVLKYNSRSYSRYSQRPRTQRRFRSKVISKNTVIKRSRFGATALAFLTASAGLFLSGVFVTLVGFPIGSRFIFPYFAKLGFYSKPKKKATLPFGRSEELSHLEKLLKRTPNNVYILDGEEEITEFARHISDKADRSLYICFRRSVNVNAAVFRLSENVWLPMGVIGEVTAAYFKLIQILLNTLCSNNGQRYATTFNFFELFEYILRGVKMMKVGPGEYPLVVIDQLDTLITRHEGAEEKITKDVYLSFLHTVSRWAVNICCDLHLCHVIMVASKEYNAESLVKHLPGLERHSKILRLEPLSSDKKVDFLRLSLKHDRRTEVLEYYEREILAFSKTEEDLRWVVDSVNEANEKDALITVVKSLRELHFHPGIIKL